MTVEYDKQELLDIMRPKGSLQEGLEELCKDFVSDGMTIVEVGCFAGASTRIFHKHLGQNGVIYCVDPWVPYNQDFDHKIALAEQVFDEFAKEHTNNIIKVKKPSIEAADDFYDESFDLVYIDADHDYESILADILAWRPKVKLGGFLAGHDFDYFPGVKQAVTENFNQVRLYIDGSWVVKAHKEVNNA